MIAAYEATTPWVRRWLRAEGIAAAVNVPGLVLAAVVLVAHTGIDRALGYRLKYPTSVQDTHLGRIGRRR